MIKPYSQVEAIFLTIFFSFWRSLVFLSISVLSFMLLSILSSFTVPMIIFALIFFIPISLLIAFVLYLAATLVSRELDKNLSKTLQFISYRIIPPIVFILIGYFSSVVADEDKIYYYLSIPLSFLIIYFFDKAIKLLDKPRKV